MRDGNRPRTRRPASAISQHSVPPSGNRLYQTFDLEEEVKRTSSHYDLPPQFFRMVIGGAWQTYSSFVWDGALSATDAQERKLEHLAELMQLRPGMRVLDVGCGWGGPLVYLCGKYRIVGHGIAITPAQIADARERAARYGVEATFALQHWRDLPSQPVYDAVYTDEVVVHFADLGGFFRKCREVLKPEGVLLNRELHLNHTSAAKLGPLSEHVNAVYGYTGNYIPLHRELQLLDANHFRLTHVEQLPIRNYVRTLDYWIDNMAAHRDQLCALTDRQTFRDFQLYLRAMRYLFARRSLFSLHIVVGHRMDTPSCSPIDG